MTQVKLLLAAVVAVVCLSAAMATPALAVEAEFLNSKGEALVKDKFTAAVGTLKIETTSGVSISCETGTGSGVISSATHGETTVLFSGCSASTGGSCKGGKDSSGEAPAGSIYLLAGLTARAITSEEFAALYTIHKPGTSESGELEITCKETKVKIKGSFLSEAVLGNTPSKSQALSMKQSKGIQNPREFENSKGEKIKSEGLSASFGGKAFEAAGAEGEFVATLEEEAAFFAKGGTFRFYILPVAVLGTGHTTGTVAVENTTAPEIEVLNAELEAVGGKKFGFAITTNNCKNVKLRNRQRCVQSISLTSQGAGEYRGLFTAKTATVEESIQLRGEF